MKGNPGVVGLALVVAGLLGMAAYFVTTHVGRPGILGGDVSRGVWFGVCIGCECLGIVMLIKGGAR